MKSLSTGIFRLIDANLNRAVEGMRVLEETARMVLDDMELTKEIKEIRHSLVQTIKSEKKFGHAVLLTRRSEDDVLRQGETEYEGYRSDLMSVIEANAGRTQEALRVLEEYGKLINPDLSGKFKAIRFSLYDIEKKLAVFVQTQSSLSRERLRIIVILENRPDTNIDLRNMLKEDSTK